MMCGVVPIASNVGAIPQVLKKYKSGYSVNLKDVNLFIKNIEHLINNPNLWQKHSHLGMKSAENFTYEAYVNHIKIILKEQWKLNL